MHGGKKAVRKLSDGSKQCSTSAVVLQERECYEGERLVRLLKLMQRGIESARGLDGDILPEKIWIKQQFAIGVNDVTRVLERMGDLSQFAKGPSVQLQAILLAADCNPRWLAKHLPSLALSRKVPVIIVKDMKGGSLRLGELVKLKTTIAIGIKDKGSAINESVQRILQGEIAELDGTPSVVPCQS